MENRPESEERRRLFVTFKTVVSVLRCEQNPDSNSSKTSSLLR